MENNPAQPSQPAPSVYPSSTPVPENTQAVPVNPVSQAQPLQPEAPQPAPIDNTPPQSKGINVKMFAIVLMVIFLLVIVLAGGYIYLKGSAKTVPIATNSELVPTATPTPKPASSEINAADTSDQALTQDSQTLDQNLNSINADLDQVNQSFNDQQTNLQ